MASSNPRGLSLKIRQPFFITFKNSSLVRSHTGNSSRESKNIQKYYGPQRCNTSSSTDKPFSTFSKSRAEAVSYPAVTAFSPHPPAGFQTRVLQPPLTSVSAPVGGLKDACRLTDKASHPSVPLHPKNSSEDGLLCLFTSSHLLITAHCRGFCIPYLINEETKVHRS